MSLADAFAGLKDARGTQVRKRPKLVSAQAPRAVTEVTSSERKGGRGESPSALPLQGTAKSTHPEFAAVKIFVRKRTHKAAGRKWEDDQGGDFSDLVEKLLSEYLST
jgi:hypothetical protein